MEYSREHFERTGNHLGMLMYDVLQELRDIKGIISGREEKAVTIEIEQPDVVIEVEEQQETTGLSLEEMKDQLKGIKGLPRGWHFMNEENMCELYQKHAGGK